MGSATSQTVMIDGQEWTTMENNSLLQMIEQSNANLHLLKDISLDIAITGESGAGKSSLVNALRGMTDFEEGAAKTGIVETTMEAKGYPHPLFPRVTIWDLPGIGTPRFKAKEYLQRVEFEKYDFFMILASECFTVNDVFLADEIRKMQKKLYYVCSKVDAVLNSERRKQNFNEERTLQNIRNYHCANLAMAGEFCPRVFIISNWDFNKYDFPLLQRTLENDLDDLKRYALITTMPNSSREILKKKKDAMEVHIWKLSLVSGAIGALPVPGLSMVCDLGILVIAMKDFCKVFGLDEDSLRRLARRFGKPLPVLRSAIKKSRVADQITLAFVTRLLKKSAVGRTMTAAEFVLNFIPVLGSVFGGIGSFATTFHMLKTFLNDVEEDAANVLAKAAEHVEF